MSLIYFVIDCLSFALGVLGIFLPLLPTTPFLLLSIACFSRSSKRIENWLYHTKMYQVYVADFRETGSIAKERKKKIILSIYILMVISIALAPIIWVKIFLFALTIFITYYLFKVIPDKEQTGKYAKKTSKQVRWHLFFGIMVDGSQRTSFQKGWIGLMLCLGLA